MWRQGILFFVACFVAQSAAASGYQAFLQELRQEAVQRKLDVALFDRALANQPEPVQKAVAKSKQQPEFAYTFNRYLKSMVSDARVRKGHEKLEQQAIALAAAEMVYGVPKEVLTALWGVESYYGTQMGNFKILPSLATLAYQSHRKAFFRKEFFHALQIVGEGHIDLDDFTGSWAGAMGQCQFMPSSFLDYAVDANADGRKDIWQSPEDVVGSAANYLNKRGWKAGQRWGQRVVLSKYLPADLKLNRHKLTERKTIAEWQRLGLLHLTGERFPQKDTLARLFLPEGPSRKAYLVYNNFDVVMKWNISSAFAFSVLTLADELGEKNG